MTKTLHLRSLDIPALHKFGIGFDTMFDDLHRMHSQQISVVNLNLQTTLRL